MKKLFSISGVFAALAAAPAWAQEGLEVIGRPVDGAMGFQPAATEVARRLQWLDGLILVIITAITLFVTALLAWVIFRYNRKRNPEAASFTHHTPIAPTGTISLSLANNASNGIEPSFSHHYARNIIREGRKTKEKVDVFSFELLAYRHMVNPGAMPFSDDEDKKLPAYFTTSDDVTPSQHVDIQAAAQKWVDSSISKTANVPTDFAYQDFKDIYLYAYDKGLKGCTTFRFNPEAFQGVLVKEKDLENTLYEFTLDDGSKVTLKGNEQVEYDGEIHNAANLFDALKEGTYGKY